MYTDMIWQIWIYLYPYMMILNVSRKKKKFLVCDFTLKMFYLQSPMSLIRLVM